MLHLLVSDCVSYQEFNLLQTDRINQITFETSKNISTVNAKGQYSIVNGQTNTVTNSLNKFDVRNYLNIL